MEIIGISHNISWKNKQENFKNLEETIKDLHCDMLILPEMFSTGFCMETQEIADRQNESLDWMMKMSRNYGFAVCGSVSVMDQDRYYNRFYFVQPNGVFSSYDKRHLFSFAKEDQFYTQGKERIIVEYGGIRFLLQICYDLRFPVFSRNCGDYDAILYVANWPSARVETWKHLLKARAIENQCYVIGINRTGNDGNRISYEESSFAYFADGTDISIKNGEVLQAILEKEKLSEFRQQFQFLKDGDYFDLHL